MNRETDCFNEGIANTVDGQNLASPLALTAQQSLNNVPRHLLHLEELQRPTSCHSYENFVRSAS